VRELEPTIEIIAEDMSLACDKIRPIPGRRSYTEPVLAARAASTLTLRRFGYSWSDIAYGFDKLSRGSVIDWANNAKAGRFAGLYPDDQTADKYAQSVAARVPGRMGGAA